MAGASAVRVLRRRARDKQEPHGGFDLRQLAVCTPNAVCRRSERMKGNAERSSTSWTLMKKVEGLMPGRRRKSRMGEDQRGGIT